MQKVETWSICKGNGECMCIYLAAYVLEGLLGILPRTDGNCHWVTDDVNYCWMTAVRKAVFVTGLVVTHLVVTRLVATHHVDRRGHHL